MSFLNNFRLQYHIKHIEKLFDEENSIEAISYLRELKRNEEAKQSYAQCLYMEHGQAWDPNGWFWSPAEDCAVYARKLARK